MEESTLSKEVIDKINEIVDSAVKNAVEKISIRLSKEQEAEFLESLISVSLGRLVQIGTEKGTQVAIDYIKQEKEKRKFERYDRRLRNTKLLLKEYRKLMIHSKDAVYSSKMNAVDILDELDSFEYEDELYIESIKKSKERTAIIVNHIKKMMSIYKCLANMSKKPEEKRRYEIIHEMYISGKEATAEELSAKYNMHCRSIYKDVDKGIEALTPLVFGIDGLKVI